MVIYIQNNLYVNSKLNLQQLNSETQEKRRKLKMTQQTIAKIMEEEDKKQNRMKEKLFQVQERREIEQKVKSLKLQEQIENVEKRIQLKKIEQQSKKIFPSIKEIFIQKKVKEEIDNTLKMYELYPSKDDQHQENNENGENNLRSQNIESIFFNLTAPSISAESMAEKTLQKMKQQIPQRKGNKDKQKQQINPFYNKQNWEKFMEAERNGEQNIRFPGIGIERTPFYEIQQAEIEKDKKKQESLQKLKKYYINPKKKNIDFDNIYKRVKSITSSSLALLKVSSSETCHMMEQSLYEARRIWGKSFLRSQSQFEFREKESEQHHLSSIQEDSISTKRLNNQDETRGKINSFSKINSSNPNQQSILRQQQEETQMQSILNQQAENSLNYQGEDESINTRRDRIFKDNIFSDSRI